MKKILEDRNYLRYLITKNYSGFPSVKVAELIKAHMYVVYDKSESIDTEQSRSIFKIRKNSHNSIILLTVSKDHLIKCSLSGTITNSLVTRKLDELADFLKENLA